MRGRRRIIPTVLASTFVALLVSPIAAMAASGLPATIAMDPESAGPGQTVRVSGLDFPGEQAVELELSTPSGDRFLGTAITEAGGYFSERVTLPGDAETGTWELTASTADGTTVSYGFSAGAAAPPREEVPAETVVASSGNSPSDIAVMLVVAVVLAAIIGGVGYVYLQAKSGHLQPGMAAGEDPFWSGKNQVSDPAKAATDEPAWLKAQKPESDPSES